MSPPAKRCAAHPALVCLLLLLTTACGKREPDVPPIEFEQGNISGQIFTHSSHTNPDTFLTALRIALQTTRDELPSPAQPATLDIRQIPPAGKRQRAPASHANAFLKDSAIHIRPTEDPLLLTYRLTHELTHWLVLQQYGTHPPLWLDEGLANLVASKSTPAAARRFQMKPRQPPPPTNALYTLDALTTLTQYPTDPGQIAAFYWQSEQLVRTLRAQLGPRPFEQFLQTVTAHPADPAHWRTYLATNHDFTPADFPSLIP